MSRSINPRPSLRGATPGRRARGTKQSMPPPRPAAWIASPSARNDDGGIWRTYLPSVLSTPQRRRASWESVQDGSGRGSAGSGGSRTRLRRTRPSRARNQCFQGLARGFPGGRVLPGRGTESLHRHVKRRHTSRLVTCSSRSGRPGDRVRSSTGSGRDRESRPGRRLCRRGRRPRRRAQRARLQGARPRARIQPFQTCCGKFSGRAPTGPFSPRVPGHGEKAG